MIFTCPASEAWQDYAVQLPAKKKIIHVRLLLPPGGADIQTIEFKNPAGDAVKYWRFNATDPVKAGSS